MVAATVSEPPQLVMAFAAHALALGAAEVHLFLDRPDEELAETLRQADRVRVTCCTGSWWQQFPGGRPWPASGRQRLNLGVVLESARYPWVLHVDADEFLWGPGDIGERLAAVPEERTHALVNVVERVHSGRIDRGNIFDGRFRHQIHGPALQDTIDRIDGAAAPLLSRGMAGYTGGKSFFRTGRGLAAGIHVPDNADPARMAVLADHAVLHFDGLTPAAWVAKKRRKIDQQPEWRAFPDSHAATRNQLAAVHAAGADREAGEAVYRRLKLLDPGRETALGALGLLIDNATDLAGQAAALFPGAGGFDAAAYDAHELRWAPRRDLQTVKHGVRALVSRITGRPPRP